jgi:hypothetical protein
LFLIGSSVYPVSEIVVHWAAHGGLPGRYPNLKRNVRDYATKIDIRTK